MTIVAVVPAHDRQDTIGATVAALREIRDVDEVVVVDDGSRDATAPAAQAAGATVLRLPRNLGKGGAATAGIRARPDADVYLLVDADVGGTGTAAAGLLGPVLSGEADMVVAVLPPAGTKGGLGRVRKFAARGIRHACGFEAAAPLSGQRAVRGTTLRSVLPLADRFGMETALTIDVRRGGGRVVEIPADMDHVHTGRSIAGFRHRGGQGSDIARALWPRVTTRPQRMAATGVAFVLVVGVAILTGGSWAPSSVPLAEHPAKVVVFGMPHLEWGDVGTGLMPHLNAMIREGAVAATSVRTLSHAPSTTEGYATVGAGTRVRADYRGAFAASTSSGGVVLREGPAIRRLSKGRYLTSQVGALGSALGVRGLQAGVVGNADLGFGAPTQRPAAIAVMTRDGVVSVGDVSPDLLVADASAPFGVRAAADQMLLATARALAAADVVVVDPGDLDRAAAFAARSSPVAATAAHRRALTTTDDLLGRVRSAAGPRALVFVVSVAPPTSTWRTTPMVAAGPGVVPGYLHSPSVRRLGVVTITDVAPTILDALGAAVPDGMIGHAVRYHPGSVDLGRLRRLDRDAAFREAIYFPMTLTYIIFQALVYLAAIVAFSRFGGVGRTGRALLWIVLAASAWPLATFLLRAVPGAARLGGAGAAALLVLIDLAIVVVARRARRHVLSPLQWILGATIVLICVDIMTGARLETASILGYSLHTAGRFTGIGNSGFAVLAASTILFGAAHVHFAPRRDDALAAVAALFAVVVLIDGAPSLGNDVGGILTLVPLFAVTLIALSGRRVRLRTLLVAGVAAVTVLALATGVDLLRPPETRTHLGRFVAQVSDHGWGTFTTTAARKLNGNFRTYKSPWCWVIVIIAVYMLFMLGWARGWTRLLPARSALRIGAVATLVAGLAGNLLNDSGAVVTALVFVYIGPFLTLLALAREDDTPSCRSLGEAAVRS